MHIVYTFSMYVKKKQQQQKNNIRRTKKQNNGACKSLGTMQSYIMQRPLWKDDVRECY